MSDHAGQHQQCSECWEVLTDEIERLRAIIRHTHTAYCDEAWTSRGRHAPECLLYEVEGSDG